MLQALILKVISFLKKLREENSILFYFHQYIISSAFSFLLGLHLVEFFFSSTTLAFLVGLETTDDLSFHLSKMSLVCLSF